MRRDEKTQHHSQQEAPPNVMCHLTGVHDGREEQVIYAILELAPAATAMDVRRGQS